MSLPSTPLRSEIGLPRPRGSGWDIFMGVLEAALGVLMIIFPLIAATITSVFIGALLLVVGVVDIFLAMRSHTAGRFFLRLLLGVVYGIGGFLLLVNPLWGVAVLTIVLGVMLIFEAATAAVLGFHVRPTPGWGWFLFDAAIAVILGILILAHWPASALWAIGTLVGVAIFVRGITRISLSLALRRRGPSVIDFQQRNAA